MTNGVRCGYFVGHWGRNREGTIVSLDQTVLDLTVLDQTVLVESPEQG